MKSSGGDTDEFTSRERHVTRYLAQSVVRKSGGDEMLDQYA
jgi:hypothetical protein